MRVLVRVRACARVCARDRYPRSKIVEGREMRGQSRVCFRETIRSILWIPLFCCCIFDYFGILIYINRQRATLHFTLTVNVQVP